MNDKLSADINILNNLNEENQDELVYFAAKSESKLREFSVEISNITTDNIGFEDIFNKISKQINENQTGTETKGLFSIFQSKIKKQPYGCSLENLINIIDDFEVQLKIQEANIIKINAILNNMKDRILETENELDELLALGNDWLNDYKRKLDRVGSNNGFIGDFSEKTALINRMENKLRDLEISKIIAFQSETQLKLMMDNNRKIIDKTIMAITQTIPLWKNQVTIMMSTDKIIKQNAAMKMISELLGNEIEKKSDIIKKRVVEYENDESNGETKLKEATRSLSELMQELKKYDKLDQKMKTELSAILLKNKK